MHGDGGAVVVDQRALDAAVRIEFAPRVLDLLRQVVLVAFLFLGIEFGLGCQVVQAFAQHAKVLLRGLDLLADGLRLHFGCFLVWMVCLAWREPCAARLVFLLACGTLRRGHRAGNPWRAPRHSGSPERKPASIRATDCLVKRNGPCVRVGLLGQRLPRQRLKPDRHRAQNALAHQVADVLRHRPLVGFDPDDAADQLAVLDADIGPAPDHLAAVVVEQHRRIALELVELPAGRLDDVAHAVDACRPTGQIHPARRPEAAPRVVHIA